MRGEVRAAPAKRVGVLDMNGLKVSRGGTSESGSYVKVRQWGRAPRRPYCKAAYAPTRPRLSLSALVEAPRSWPSSSDSMSVSWGSAQLIRDVAVV